MISQQVLDHGVKHTTIVDGKASPQRRHHTKPGSKYYGCKKDKHPHVVGAQFLFLHIYFVYFFCHSQSLFNASMGDRAFTSRLLISSSNGLVSGNKSACCAASGSNFPARPEVLS